MFAASEKVIIAAPECRRSYGKGHIMRTLILLSRFQNPKSIYLIANDSLGECSSHALKYILCKDIRCVPKVCLQEKIVFLCDTYDTDYSLALYRYMQGHANKQDCDFVMLCDTFESAQRCVAYMPTASLLFPNILPNNLQMKLNVLARSRPNSLYTGHEYLLLDQETLYISDVDEPKNIFSTPPVCLVTFGFSSFSATDILIRHMGLCIKNISRHLPGIRFILIGENALNIFAKLDMQVEFLKYYEFCSKEQLINIYDASTFHLGSVGYSIWERAFRLLPSFVYAIAENQLPYVDVGNKLNILRASDEILTPDFNMKRSLEDMYLGTLDFRLKILKSTQVTYNGSID